MKAPRTLRTRIVFYFCGYLAVLLTLYSGALIGVFRGAEDKAFNRQISEIAGRLARHVEAWGEIPAYLPEHVSAHIGLTNVPPLLKNKIKNRRPGVFEIDADDRGYHVAVVPLESFDRTLYVFYDVTSIEAADRFESYMVFALVTIGLGVLSMGWLLARALSNGILNPVSALAAAVQSLSISQNTVELRTFTTADEVGVLARTVDRLVNRISAFARREREFTSHASHELRTPVTVIKGAVEIIRQRSDQTDATLRRPLERIERAVNEIENLIDTFLMLARQDQLPDKDASCSLPAVVETVVATYRYLLADKPVDVKIRTAGSGTLKAPPLHRDHRHGQPGPQCLPVYPAGRGRYPDGGRPARMDHR